MSEDVVTDVGRGSRTAGLRDASRSSISASRPDCRKPCKHPSSAAASTPPPRTSRYAAPAPGSLARCQHRDPDR